MSAFLCLPMLLLFWSHCTICYHLVYLDGYPGNLKLIEFTDLTAAVPPMLNLSNAIDITPVSLLNKCGNPDISPDGTQIIFGAITASVDSWDIYSAHLDVEQGTISNLQIIVDTAMREEDPRYSYDGNTFVYKAGGSSIYDIYVYDFRQQKSSKMVECSCHSICASDCNHCELWGPSYHPCGHSISYTGRICENEVNYDEIWIFDGNKNISSQITSNSLPDMFSHWKRDGNLLYSHNDASTDHLYLYDSNSHQSVLFVDETKSDDDPYAFKQNNGMFIFIGLADNGEGYELWLYRNGSVFQLSSVSDSDSSMLGPVAFSSEIAVTTPTYCDDFSRSVLAHTNTLFFSFFILLGLVM